MLIWQKLRWPLSQINPIFQFSTKFRETNRPNNRKISQLTPAWYLKREYFKLFCYLSVCDIYNVYELLIAIKQISWIFVESNIHMLHLHLNAKWFTLEIFSYIFAWKCEKKALQNEFIILHILWQNFIFSTVSRAKGRPYHKSVGIGSRSTGEKEGILILLLSEWCF